MTSIEAAAACYPTDVHALARAINTLPQVARAAFITAIEAGEGWDAAAMHASLAAPGVPIISPFGERIDGQLRE